MSREQHIHDLFDRAVELPREGRAAFLEEACGEDAALRGEVEALLRAHDSAGQFLAEPTVLPHALLAANHLGVGAQVGPYQLLRVLGEGGYGIVYEAQQLQPLQRKVALKVIKAGMDTQQVIARFELERQALARMEHPGIARVLDAGATPGGRPYFVMELVEGPPITEYCRANRLSLTDRLDLFAAVCRAVQHAHQKGIIHRDLKPRNVLVGSHDGRPVPKVIDFGIAKALHPQANGNTLTLVPQLLGTPHYMSPEQATGAPADLDTRSDIYSLGVLLYELLTDTPPFEPVELRSAAYAEVQRIISQTDPPPPSARLATQTRSLTTSELRAEARRRKDMVRGDLDWIVLKAMEKDRERRYSTAQALEEDLRRHLNSEPISAGSPTRLYLLQKFARRHRRSLFTAGAVFGALILGLAGAIWGMVLAHRSAVAEKTQRGIAERQTLLAQTNAREAREQADRLLAAQSAVYHLLDFGATDGTDAPPAVLDFVTARADEGPLSKHPDAEAPVRTALGMAYYRQNRWADAEKQLRRALMLDRQLRGEQTPDAAALLAHIGVTLMYQKKYAQAVPVFRESLQIYQACGFKVVAPGAVKSNLAAALAAEGDLDGAENILRDALTAAHGTGSELRYDALFAIRTLAGVLRETGDRQGSDELVNAIQTLRERLGNTLVRAVRPGADGSFVLAPITADLHGIGLEFEADQSIGGWDNGNEYVLWTLAPQVPGRYRLEVQYACDNDSAAGELVLEVAGQTLRGAVRAREGSQQYVIETLGTVRLPQRISKLVVRPSSAASFHAAGVRLRAVQLTAIGTASGPGS